MSNSIASPSRSRSSSVSSFDEAYFLKTYVPLSNLPTPPISSQPNAPQTPLTSGEFLQPDLLGPATHLTNLIPSSTSLTTPSISLVHVLLTRANLPIETLALAVCILDSLNSRFARTWRQGCPLLQEHIDSVHPEVIVLAALILAVKFLDDRPGTMKQYALEWGKEMWSHQQINFTQRCLLENLGYRLLPLWKEDIIGETLEDMRRAASHDVGLEMNWDANTCFGSFEKGMRMDGGRAIAGFGEQLTPAETPMVENVRGTRDISVETKMAFTSGLGNEGPLFHLSDMSSNCMEESFPLYVDPMMEGLGLGR